MKNKIGQFTLIQKNNEYYLIRNNKYYPGYTYAIKLLLILTIIIVLKNEEEAEILFYLFIAALIFLISQIFDIIEKIRTPFIFKIKSNYIYTINSTINLNDIKNISITNSNDSEFDIKKLFLQTNNQRILVIETSGYKSDIDLIATNLSNILNIDIHYN